MADEFVGEESDFRAFIKRVPFTAAWKAHPELTFVWVDLAADASGKCIEPDRLINPTNDRYKPDLMTVTNVRSLKLTNLIISYLLNQGVKDPVISNALTMSKTNFATSALISYVNINAAAVDEKHQFANPRSVSTAEYNRAAARYLAWKYEIAVRSGNANEMKTLQGLATEMLMGYGEALQNRTATMAAGQEMLQNMRMTSNIVTIPQRR